MSGISMNRDEISRIHAIARSEAPLLAKGATSQLSSRSTEEERQLFELCASMSQGVVCMDADEGVIMANAAAQSMLAMSLEEMQQRAPLELPWSAIQEDGAPFSYESHPVVQALNTGQPISNVIMGIYSAKEYAYRWLKVDVIPQTRATDYTPLRVFAILQD